MRILGSGDHHFYQHSRFEECRRVHSWLVEVAREEKADVFVSGGDVFEGVSTPLEREAFADFVTPMAEICPVVIAKGNHDKAKDVEFMRRLRTKHPVVVEERAGVHYVAGAAIACVAWPERQFVVSTAPSQESADLVIREALQSLFRGLGDELAAFDGPRVGLGHFMVDGSITSVGQPLLGQPINVSLADLALLRAHIGFMGHIHKRQTFDVYGVPWLYTGSPFRTEHGQREPKVVVLAEFDGPRLVSVRDIETPATPMTHLKSTWRDGAFVPDADSDMSCAAAGAEVKFTFKVSVEHRIAANAAADALKSELLGGGAVSVRLDPTVIVETRSRMPEVSLAKTFDEKLEAFWKSKGFEPAERRAPMLEKLGTLEQEARDAA